MGSALTPIEVVEQWQERAWGNGDLDAVDDLVAERFIRHGPTGTKVQSPAELKDDLRQYQRALHKPAITVHDRVVDRDKVWSRITMKGVNLDTGECRTVEWVQIHRVDGGRIVEAWSLYTTGASWD